MSFWCFETKRVTAVNPTRTGAFWWRRIIRNCCFIRWCIALHPSKMSVKVQIVYGFLFVILLLNAQNNYGVRADDKNITRLLNNQVIVSRQIMCVLDKSPCDQLGRQLKGIWSAYAALFMNYSLNLNGFRYYHSPPQPTPQYHNTQPNQSINGNKLYFVPGCHRSNSQQNNELLLLFFH